MAHWKREDEEREEHLKQLIVCVSGIYEPHYIEAETQKEQANAPMHGTKNLSPYRVYVRRQKNKAARKARSRNRK